MSPTREARGGRPREVVMVNPFTDPRRHVGLRVAAAFIGIDVRTLDRWIDEGTIEAVPFGRFRRIPVHALRPFHVERNTA